MTDEQNPTTPATTDEASSHPFDLPGLRAPVMARRVSGEDTFDLMQEVLDFLVERGCGAKEAIEVCISAAGYGAHWFDCQPDVEECSHVVYYGAIDENEVLMRAPCDGSEDEAEDEEDGPASGRRDVSKMN
jgi:hypothetical protein